MEQPDPEPIRRWKTLLTFYKNREQANQLALLRGLSTKARQLFLSWPHMDHPFRPLEDWPMPPHDPEEILGDPTFVRYPSLTMWDWLWNCTIINRMIWRTLAGYTLVSHQDTFEMNAKILKGNRLIYPDGKVLALGDKFIERIANETKF